MAAYVFLAFLTLLCLANVLIALPLAKPVDLGSVGADGLGGQRGTWYVLDAGAYSVGSNFDSVSIRSSFVPFLSKRYSYYLVTVEPKTGAPFSMAVRVTASKQSQMERGQTVSLYGMVSGLTGDTAVQAQAAAGDQTVQLQCLNDNGDTGAKRVLKAGIFLLAAIGCIFLIVRLARRH